MIQILSTLQNERQFVVEKRIDSFQSLKSTRRFRCKWQISL